MIKSIGMAKTFALSALLLSACGGSSDDETPPVSNPPPPPATGGGDDNGTPTAFWQEGPDPSVAGSELRTFELSGVVGYNAPVAGAEVCVDTNRDFTCDSDSPTAITAENGSYSLTVEAPYEAAEFFILAKFSAYDVQQGMRSSSVLADSGEITLSARAYYGGHINPLTMLEAEQYDESLSYLQQVEQYAISRVLINDLYQLPVNADAAQIFTSSGLHEAIKEEWAERNDAVLYAYREAGEYVSNPMQALRLSASKPDPEFIAETAEWFGFAPASGSLTNAQRQKAENSFLTAGQQVVAAFYPDGVDMINELTDELAEFRAYSGQYRLYVDVLSEDYEYETEMCWNEDESRWRDSGNGIAAYTTPTRVDDHTYAMNKLSNGQEVLIHISALSEDSDFYSTALAGWDEELDLSMAQVDGALVRGRYELADELCVEYYGSTSRDSTAFSNMSGSDVVALASPVAHQMGSYETNDDLQRITLTSTGYQYDYRVIERGDRELLMMLAVHSSPMGSYPIVWSWHEGQVERVGYFPAHRANALFAEVAQFAIGDQAAADLLTQLRALAQ